MKKLENLEQARALNAFRACEGSVMGGVDGGEVVKKLPPMIRENGMLGALAYALGKADKGSGYSNAFQAICEHLHAIGKVNSGTVEGLQNELMECPALKLRDVTSETMLFLDYMRRFAKKNDKGGE